MPTLEYKSLLGGWKVLRSLYEEANIQDWVEWAKRNYTWVRVTINGKVVA